MNIPEELRYTKDHEWLRVEDDHVIVGVTDFAQGELGDIVFVEIGSVGETLDQEEVFGTIEAVKTVSDLFMPVSGQLILNLIYHYKPRKPILFCGAMRPLL